MSNLLSREKYTIDLDSICFDVDNTSRDVKRNPDTNEVLSYTGVFAPSISVSFFMNDTPDYTHTIFVYFDELGQLPCAKNDLTCKLYAGEFNPIDLTNITSDTIIKKIDEAIELFAKDLHNRWLWDSAEAQINRAFKKAISEIKA